VEDVILEVVGPAFATIGHAWETDRASVATEHLATHYLRHRLLMWMLSGPPPRPVRPVVLACAPEELHEGSLLILGALLRRQRWPVAYLGQTVPLADLAGFVTSLKPPAIVVVAMAEESARALAQWPHWLPDATGLGGPILSYGGRIFSQQPEWRQQVPGVFLGATIREGYDRLLRLLRENSVVSSQPLI
jgi:hypothetical protein